MEKFDITLEEKELLFKDLCARLPYGVLIFGTYNFDICFSQYICEPLNSRMLDITEWNKQRSSYDSNWYSDIRPFLRPMSSMTEEEHEEYKSLFELFGKIPVIKQNDKYFDFINSHHFDYRGLIPMGLALEASKGMYKTK